MGELPLLQQVHGQPSACTYTAVICAGLNGSLEMLRWLKAKVPSLFLHSQIRCSMWRSTLRRSVAVLTVKWLVSAFPDTVWPLDPAALGGHFNVLKWLHENANLEIDSYYGPIPKLLFIDCCSYIEKCGMDNHDALGGIKRGFYLAMAPRATDAMDWAAEKGHLNVIKWLYGNRVEGCSSAALTVAAAEGRKDILLFLHENYSDRWTYAAMDHAARGGHLEIVQWMNENRSEGCSTDASEHRSEGCTRLAMDAAATKGHLEVVEWLHEYR